MPADAQSVLRRADEAFLEQSKQLPDWREATNYCLPIPIYQIGGSNESPYRSNPNLCNDTAMQARRDLSSGMSSAFFNAGEQWFAYQASDIIPPQARTKANEWFAECTRRTFRTLPRSGFYDRGVVSLDHAAAIGTSAMMIEGAVPGSDSSLNCNTWDIGSYAIAENCAGIVNQIWREVQYTVDQAEREWPDFQPDKFQLLSPEKKLTQKEVFVFEIRPRDTQEVRPGMGNLQMPYEGTWVHKELKQVVHRTGWEEFPVRVYRYARQAASTPWGTGPGIDSLASVRGVNYLDADLADGISKMASPPVAAMSNIRGTLDLRSRGVTMVENMNDRPQPIFTVGNMQAGQLFLDKKENAVRRHFHSDLFSFFLNDDRFKTATVALQIASEKLGLFAPFGHRFLNEWVDPSLERIFMVHFRAGAFPPAPKECLVQTPKGWQFVYPKVVQQSRMALALQEMGKQDVRQFIQDMTPIFQIEPREVRRVNWSVASKLLGANEVTMPGLIKSDEQFQAEMEAEMQAAQQAQAQEQMANFATKNPDHAAAALNSAAA